MIAAGHLTAALALAGAAGVAQAQSATIGATATVGTGLSVSGLAPLDFGTVYQGVNKNINFNNASSGRFRIDGLDASQVALTFALPATLVNGTNTLPISNYDVRVNGTSSTASANAIPVISGVPTPTNLVNGVLYVFIGGRVTTAVSQTPGSYTGLIVLAAAYTGL